VTESAVLLRIAAIVVALWLAGLAAVKLGELYRILDHEDHLDSEPSPAPGDVATFTTSGDSDALKAPAASSVLPSTLTVGATSTVRISGSRMSGAAVPITLPPSRVPVTTAGALDVDVERRQPTRLTAPRKSFALPGH
jgi:hypothetical protein